MDLEISIMEESDHYVQEGSIPTIDFQAKDENHNLLLNHLIFAQILKTKI